MANIASIARPYALAAFECARAEKQMPAWKHFLEEAAWLATQPAVTSLLANPALPAEKILTFFMDILASLLMMSKEQQNFLRLIAQNQRFNALPDISERFNAYDAALEKISHVRLVTAVEADAAFQQKLSNALSQRIHREVKLACEIDPEIIGGAVIHIGDRVIDGSVRGKLTRLLATLTG